MPNILFVPCVIRAPLAQARKHFTPPVQSHFRSLVLVARSRFQVSINSILKQQPFEQKQIRKNPQWPPIRWLKSIFTGRYPRWHRVKFEISLWLTSRHSCLSQVTGSLHTMWSCKTYDGDAFHHWLQSYITKIPQGIPGKGALLTAMRYIAMSRRKFDDN